MTDPGQHASQGIEDNAQSRACAVGGEIEFMAPEEFLKARNLEFATVGKACFRTVFQLSCGVDRMAMHAAFPATNGPVN